ncbi:MAG: DUF5686 and carboxypeptidase regulatory-like domain-containing protein [Culturomica sp.]|jgi:hypothetical protein|nr:DUF5686 and carboxypeptidase regulatory-like domain-containing protein [Culturomica sp.]
MKKAIPILFVFTLYATLVCAQSTRIRGVITDAETGESLPFVNVFFTGTTIGVSSDMDGNYNVETREEVSELTVSMVGYGSQTKKITPNNYQTLNFQLTPLNIQLDNVVVTPGENPAHKILRNVIKNKKINNPDKLNAYSCATYTKMELDLTGIEADRTFRNKRMQRDFGFIFNYVDTSILTGKSYLPIMISESIADYYYSRNPSLSREVIKASRISGVEEDYTLAQFTGQLHGKVNFYDNYVDVFDVHFASPLSDHGLLYYKYFLIDSLQVNDRKTYYIRFHPRSLSTPVLDGELHIDSLSWGLEYAKVKMMKGVNVNWIRYLSLEDSYQLVNDTTWFLKQSKMSADFSVVLSDSSKLTSFLGNREVTYSNIDVSGYIPPSIRKLDNNVVISKDVLNTDDDYWDKMRPYKLSQKEQDIYTMVDSIKQAPLYQTVYTMISTIFGGYYKAGKLELGPYYKMLSHNDLEDYHFQFGARTTSDFNKKLRLSAHLGYGTKDKRVKGGGGVEYVFNNQPTTKLHFKYRYDATQLGAGTNAFTSGNVMNSILSRGNKDKLSIVEQMELNFEREWRQGISNFITVKHQDINSSEFVPFVRPDGSAASHVRSTALSLRTRLSKNETVTRYNFEKYSFGSDYPIVTLDFSAGLNGLCSNDYEYYRLEGNIDYEFDIPPIGTSEMIVNIGKIFGNVPYPLLKLHEGNGTFFYDQYSFSCMNYYEFASDKWISFFWEHHFKGFFLGKIPLMKRLKWREVFVLKGVIGTLSDSNNGSLPNTDAVFLFPAGMGSVSKPYFETGVGVENILRMFRFDAIWRLSHRNNPDASNFTVSFSVNLDF